MFPPTPGSQLPPHTDPSKVGFICQIIAGALITSVVIMACVTFFITQGDGPPLPMISFIGAGFAVIATVMRFLVPILIVNGGKSQLKQANDAERYSRLAGLYQAKMIVGMALLEGAAFMNLIAYMVEKQIWSYGVVAFLLAVMAISFPSQGQFESWAEETKRNLN